MKYDFDTIYKRHNMGSNKWKNMVTSTGFRPDVIPFSVADMEFRTAPEIIEAIKERAEFGLLGYSYVTDSFRDAVESWMLRRHQWKVDREWMMFFAGVIPAAHTVLRAFSDPGDRVIIQRPVYYPFFNTIVNTGRTVVNNPLKLVGGDHYEMDFDDLEEKAKDAKMMILCSPQNPVGRVWTREELTRVAEICTRHKVVLYVDEIHGDLVYKPNVFCPYGTLGEELTQNCVIATGATKSFSLAGLWCSTLFIQNEELRQRLTAQQREDGMMLNTIFGYLATEIAYNKGEAWLDQCIEYIHANYLYLKEFFSKHFPLIKVFDLEGTYLVWCDFRSFGMEPLELKRFMTDEAHLFLDEGYIFGEEGNGFERISISCPRKALEEGLWRLYEAAKRGGIPGVE